MKGKFKVPRTRKTARKYGKKTYTKSTVMYKMVKPEKKYIDYVPVSYQGETKIDNHIGQIDGDYNNEGAYVSDITPIIATGTTFNNRVGQVVKMSSLIIRSQFISQADSKIGLRFKVQIFYKKDYSPVDYSTNNGSVLRRIYDINPLTTLYDINTLRDPNNLSTYRQVYNKTYVMPADQFDTQGDRIKDVSINLKQNRVIRYNDEDLTGKPAEGQYILVIQCNTGNRNPAVSPASPIPNVAQNDANTGANMVMNIRAYFTDV